MRLKFYNMEKRSLLSCAGDGLATRFHSAHPNNATNHKYKFKDRTEKIGRRPKTGGFFLTFSVSVNGVARKILPLLRIQLPILEHRTFSGAGYVRPKWHF